MDVDADGHETDVVRVCARHGVEVAEPSGHPRVPLLEDLGAGQPRLSALVVEAPGGPALLRVSQLLRRARSLLLAPRIYQKVLVEGPPRPYLVQKAGCLVGGRDPRAERRVRRGDR